MQADPRRLPSPELIPFLFDSIRTGSTPRVKQLLEHDPSLWMALGDEGETPILSALYYCAGRVVDLLLDSGAQPDIYEAAALGNDARVKEFLAEEPALARTFSADGWTPLHLAAYFGHSRAADLLVKAGANVMQKSSNRQGNTPLHAAVAGCQPCMVRLLLRQGAEVNSCDASGSSPLHLAAQEGMNEILGLLIKHGAAVDLSRRDGATPLMAALLRGQQNAARLLRIHNAPLRVKS